jgi:hypothetical protein
MLGWSHYKSIAVLDTKVDADLADFPLLVAADGDAEIGARAKADGSDLRFTLDDGTPLDFEIEYFYIDGGLAYFRIWVRVPSILASGGAAIRCWYGNPAAAAWDGDPADVWTPSGYRGVWHFRGGSLVNSANAAKPLSAVGSPTFLAGGGPFAWMDAYQLGGANRLTLADALGLSLPLTLSGWGSFATTSGEPRFLDLRAGTSHHRRSIYMVSSNTIRVQSNTPTTYGFVAVAVSLDEWNKWDGAFETTSLRRGYKNGALAGSNTTSVTGIDAPDNIGIGEANCKVAEARLSNVARSAEWLKFEHANLANAGWEQEWGEERRVGPARLRIDAAPRYGLLARARPRTTLDIGAR